MLNAIEFRTPIVLAISPPHIPISPAFAGQAFTPQRADTPIIVNITYLMGRSEVQLLIALSSSMGIINYDQFFFFKQYICMFFGFQMKKYF